MTFYCDKEEFRRVYIKINYVVDFVEHIDILMSVKVNTVALYLYSQKPLRFITSLQFNYFTGPARAASTRLRQCSEC